MVIGLKNTCFKPEIIGERILVRMFPEIIPI